MKTPLQVLLFLCATFSLTFQLAAQTRYTTTDFFSDYTKTPNITFGFSAGRSYSSNTDYPSQARMLDFYQPTGDAATKRPLVILAFGGGFVQGDRTQLDSIALTLAKRGFTVASIDYRIVDQGPDQVSVFFASADGKTAILRDVIVKASSDMKAAIRFFKHDAATANTYKIDTTKIFIGGASAGAITALQTAYTDDAGENPDLVAAYAANGGLEGNTDLAAPNNLIGRYSATGIAGVLNIAGGTLSTNIIDANDPAVYSAQGDMDEVVPYTSGPLSFNGISIPTMFYGSAPITARASSLGLRNNLYTITGGRHETPGAHPYIDNIISQASLFMATVNGDVPLPVKLVSFIVKANRCAAQFNWQTAMEVKSSHFDIESSTDGINFTKVATVKSKNAGNGAAYSYSLNAGAKQASYRLKMTDIDGNFSYSPVQRFVSQCADISVQVYPNPVKDKATVSGVEKGMLVDVLTTDGRLIWSQRAAGNTVTIPVSSFNTGLLLVQVRAENGDVISSTKLMRQ